MSDNEHEDNEHEDNEHEDNEDVAWLLASDRGQLGPTVSDAITARYARLQSLIADLPATPAGATRQEGWEQGVLAAIDAGEAEPDTPSNPAPVLSIDGATPKQRSTRRRRWAAATAIVAMAGVAILLAAYRDRGGEPDGPVAEPLLAFEVEPADRPRRSADPSVGDTLIVRGVVGGPGELRVYNADGIEQARCTGHAPDCRVERTGKHTTLRLTIPLRVAGPLRAVLFAAPLGGPSGGIDADLEAAMRAGIARTPRDLVDVH